MNQKQREAVYDKALKQWGDGHLMNMFQEESAELSILISKKLRGDFISNIKMADGIADCYNVLDALVYLLDVEKQVDEIKVEKLEAVLKKAIDSEIRQDVR